MPRPKKGNPKNRQFRLRMTEADFDWLDTMAHELGRTKTEVIMDGLVLMKSCVVEDKGPWMEQKTIREKYSEIHNAVLKKIEEGCSGYDFEDLQRDEWVLYKAASILGISLSSPAGIRIDSEEE